MSSSSRPTALKLRSSASSSIPRYLPIADLRPRPASPPETPQLSTSPTSSTVSTSTTTFSPPSPPFPSPTSSTSSFYKSMIMRKSPSMSINENVQVMVRMRPLSTEELEAGQATYWNVSEKTIQPKENTSPDKVFNVDTVVDGESNRDVYDNGIDALVRSTMAGYNGTVFAYGQTASGKTYTMMGTPEEPGVIPRAINDVFAYIEEHAGEEFMLRVSYLEIYKEKIRDLLATVDDGAPPSIVEDPERGVHVRNLNEIIVKSPDQVLDIIKKGEASRHVSATDYNARSSRSHTLFQMTIESRRKYSHPGEVKISQLNLIDLAGSEKAASNLDRRKEGACINRSLLTLGMVISMLSKSANSRGEKPFVPYRDSTLTRILQTSLSGNARIWVICTINPTKNSKDESLNTMRFARNAKLIKTTAKLTKVSEHSELQKCLEQIEELQNVMKEKTEQEEETCKRLSHLLGLILTSSKTHHVDLDTMSDTLSTSITSNGSANPGTMRLVIEQCEKGITEHREEMVRLERNLLAANQEITHLKLKLAAAEENALAFGQKCDALETGIQASHAENRILQDSLELANSKISDLQRQLLSSVDQQQALEAMLQEISRERDEYVEHNREYKQQVEHLMSRMASLENELKEAMAAEEDICTIKDSCSLNGDAPSSIPLKEEDVTVVEHDSQGRGKETQRYKCNTQVYGGLWMVVLMSAVYAAQLQLS